MSQQSLTLDQRHPYHMVDPSPWPFVMSIALLTMTSGGVMWFHSYSGGGYTLLTGMFGLFFTMYVWWRDIVREATYEGQHTEMVQAGMSMGMILFIASEVMFFFGFFWAFFHAALVPVQEIGCVWPPQGIEVFNPWEIPLLNTVILVTSGATCTWAHHAIIAGDRRDAILGLILTLVLAVIFTGFQGYEYSHASFTISDGIYGSCFYMATGFHGFHVCIGTLFLTVCLVRLIQHHFTREHHFGFEAASWYWHFVDVVWLFLFVAVYWWGGA
jgi:heme/copper-type cytochrome/quinol oxidase subunit 3